MNSVSADQLVLFTATLAVAILSPGPGVIAVSQSAFALGRGRAMPYGWGLAFGASLWCLFSLLGLAMLFGLMPWTYTALKIAGACRLNVVISGGTGSGKTTMLNALSKMIDPGERVLTIEDAAELRLQQPHWLPRNAPRQPRRSGRDQHPRSRQERAAYAPGSHHPGRNPRRRVFRHALGDEHRP